MGTSAYAPGGLVEVRAALELFRRKTRGDMRGQELAAFAGLCQAVTAAEALLPVVSRAEKS